MLSGFLIGGTLIKILNKGNISFNTLLNFWTRRWLRTLPNYLFILIILIILKLHFSADFKITNALPFFVFIQNIYKPSLSFFTESWSLSVEEWFYLLIPPLLFFLTWLFKFKVKSIILLTAISLILSVTIFRYYRFTMEPIPQTKADWGALFYFPVSTRIDSIMFGLMGAYVTFYHHDIWVKFKLPLFYFGLSLFLVDKLVFTNLGYATMYTCLFSFTTLSVGTLCMLPFMSQIKTGSGILYKSITYTSLISYSMYLINFSLISYFGLNIVFGALNHVGIHLGVQQAYILRFLIFIISTFTFSILLYKYIEQPFMRMRKKEHQ